MAPINPNEALRLAQQALQAAQEQKRQNESFMRSIGPAIVDALTPLLVDLKKAVGLLKVDVTPNVTVNPEIKIPRIELPNIIVPDIHVPEAQITVNVPPITIPPIRVPEIVWPKDMELQGFMRVIGWDRSLLENPMPVQLRDAKGRPVDLSNIGGGAVLGGDSGGGNFPMAVYDPATSALKVTGTFTASAPASQAVGLYNTESIAYNGDNPLPVTFPSTASLPVSQVSGSIFSVNVVGASASVAVNISDSSGVGYSGSNPLPVTLVSGGSATSATNIVDSSGVAYSGSNPVPVSNIGLAVDNGDAATAQRVVIAGNSNSSVFATNPVDNGDSATALRVVVAGNSSASVVVNNPQGPGEQATALRVLVAGDSSASVSIRDFNGTAPATGLNETNAGVLRVVVMTDSVTSVYVNNPVAQGDAATALRVVVAGNSDASVVVNSGTLTAITNTLTQQQLSGAVDSVFVVGPIAQGDAATAVRVVIAGNSDMSVYANNPVNQGDAATALRVVIAGNSDASVSVNNTVTVSGSLTSVVAVGDIVADAADTGSAPLKTGGIARTTQPSAVADGDRVSFTADKMGRQLVRPVQIRDLIKTAYVSIANGTETTLLAGVAGSFLDLIMITATNNSTAATQLDIRAVTAGNIIHTMYLPASTGPVGFTPSVPWPQDATGNNWTIDMPDQTGTTVYVSALFSQES